MLLDSIESATLQLHKGLLTGEIDFFNMVKSVTITMNVNELGPLLFLEVGMQEAIDSTAGIIIEQSRRVHHFTS